MSPSRYYSLDLGKFVAAVLVIMIHTAPLSSFSRLGNAILIQIVCRLAVPFFFLCSGYFLRRKLEKSGTPAIQWSAIGHCIRSLGSVYLVWTAVWILCHLLSGADCFYPAAEWVQYIYPGIYQLLWFMPALLIGEIVLVLCFRPGRRKNWLLVAAAVFLLQTVAGFGGDYPGAEILRSPLWVGIYYVATGALIFDWESRSVSPILLLGIVLLCVCGLLGSYWLQKSVGVKISPVVFVVPEIACIFRWLLSCRIPETWERKLPSLWFRDRSVLLYVSQGIVIFYAERLWNSSNSGIFFAIVLCGSLMLGEGVLLLAKILPLRRICF